MKKILITDDQAEVRELVEVTLSVGDYLILQADSGNKAVEIARSQKPDLIIMDIMMPGELDGLEATKIIKDDPGCDNCKIVMLTAKGQQADKEAGYKAGADGYFAKPFSPLELINKVEEILG